MVVLIITMDMIKGSGILETNMDSVAKFNIPLYFFGDEANTRVAHAIGGNSG